MNIFALIDCNNFYASCERAFNPKLEGKPIVVLSNNDGCIIARSNEAKKLGIPMGAPFFKWQQLCEKNKVYVFSSNYELYGDISSRVMDVLQNFFPEVEIYSIDEAFILLNRFRNDDLVDLMQEVRCAVKQWVGIPVSVGIGPTKTLAKAANYAAKNFIPASVCSVMDKDIQSEILQQIPLDKVWGIGRQLSKKFMAMDIHTAKDLRDTDPKLLRLYSSVTTEKTALELRGIPCMGLENPQPRKQIISSRSFGKKITELKDLEEAISFYSSIASVKLRKQKCEVSLLRVFVQTNFFNEKERQYENSLGYRFPMPTADTRYIINAAKKCLRKIFRSGYRYHKAGVMLLELIPSQVKQLDLFAAHSCKSELLMRSIDHINKTIGKNAIFYGAEGIQQDWKIKAQKSSPRSSTQLEDIHKCR